MNVLQKAQAYDKFYKELTNGVKSKSVWLSSFYAQMMTELGIDENAELELTDPPVAQVVRNSAGQISLFAMDGRMFDISTVVDMVFYAVPRGQPMLNFFMSDQQKLAETNYAERQVAIEKAKRKMDDALRDGDNLGAMEAVDNIINHATKIRKILVTNKLK
jgi:hypothetical protein